MGLSPPTKDDDLQQALQANKEAEEKCEAQATNIKEFRQELEMAKYDLAELQTDKENLLFIRNKLQTRQLRKIEH